MWNKIYKKFPIKQKKAPAIKPVPFNMEWRRYNGSDHTQTL